MPSLHYIIVEWLIPLVMVPFVARNRRPFPAIAWLGFIFAVPWVGVPLYLLIGEYGLRRARKNRPAPGQAWGEGGIETNDLPARARSLARAVHGLARDRGVAAPILPAESVALLQDMDAVDRLVADIETAVHHAHLLFFIYADDETGWRVARALASAAERGVECRLLMDAHGSRKAWRAVRPWLVERGVQVGRALKIAPLQNPVRRIDVRNHRKIAVIDGTVAYTGSMNVHGPKYDLDEGAWSQITVRIEGQAVQRLQRVFAHDWGRSKDEELGPEALRLPANSAASAVGDGSASTPSTRSTVSVPSTPPPAAGGPVPVHVLEDGPSYSCNSLQPMLVELLHSARERVGLTTPYLVPDQPVLVAVRMAALRGVEVNVYVPRTSDRGLADAAGRAIFDELMSAGVRIHRYGPGVLHAKTVTVDDTIAVVGTANLDYRSFYLNYEVVVIMYHEQTARALRAMQEGYGRDSEQIDPTEWAERPRSHRVQDDVARLFSPLL